MVTETLFTAGEVVFTGFCGDYRSIGTQHKFAPFSLLMDEQVSVCQKLEFILSASWTFQRENAGHASFRPFLCSRNVTLNLERTLNASSYAKA